MEADLPILREALPEVRWAGLSGVLWAARLVVLWVALRVDRWEDPQGRLALPLTVRPARGPHHRRTVEGSRLTCVHLQAVHRNLDTMGEDAEVLPPDQATAHLGPLVPTSVWLSQTGPPVWTALRTTLSTLTLLIQRLRAIHVGDRPLAVDLPGRAPVPVPVLRGVRHHRINTEVATEARTATHIRMTAAMTMAQTDRDRVFSRQREAGMPRDQSATTTFRT